MISSKYHQFKWSNNWTFWTGNCKRVSSHLIQVLNYWGMSKNSKGGRKFQEGGRSSINGFIYLTSGWNILLLLDTINVSFHNHTHWKTNIFSWEVDKQDIMDQNEFFSFQAIKTCTEKSKCFERKPFRVLLIIKNHWSFKNTHESLLSEPLRVAFIKNHRLKISLRYVKVYKVCRMSKPI